MKERLQRTWRWRNAEPKDSVLAENEWRKAVGTFEETAAVLNKQIDAYNLIIPADVFYRPRIIPAQEIKNLKEDRS